MNLTKVLLTDGRALPLTFGKKSRLKIKDANPTHLHREFSWTIPDGKAQVLRAELDEMPQLQMIVFVKATRGEPVLEEDEGLTIAHLAKVKKKLEAKPQLSVFAAHSTDDEPASPNETSKPLNLSLKCGGADGEQSLNTTIGLANRTTLSVEGDIESQQISTETVQIRGSQFSFKNEDEDSFSAKAETGSISFSRGGALEKTMQLTLQTNARLKFAGIEFVADSISCVPNQIKAQGNVKVSIPEIESTVSAGLVVLDLKSLAFDFDGNVAVERKVEGASFPFLLKSTHVGWSLVSGEMQTDKRFTQPTPNRSAFGVGTGARNRFPLGNTQASRFSTTTSGPETPANRLPPTVRFQPNIQRQEQPPRSPFGQRQK